MAANANNARQLAAIALALDATEGSPESAAECLREATRYVSDCENRVVTQGKAIAAVRNQPRMKSRKVTKMTG